MKTTNSVRHEKNRFVMYFISPFDSWVLSVQKIEFFCVLQSYLTVVEYSSSFARQKPQIIVCWINYRFVFPPRLLLRFHLTSFCICMRFFISAFCFFTTCSLLGSFSLPVSFCVFILPLFAFVCVFFYFGFLFFRCMFIVSSKAAILSPKSFDFWVLTMENI
ncbi:hypothetical protein AAZX31_01G098300 [Glycine max]